MKRKLFTLALTALLAGSAFALPVRRGVFEVKQADGTTVAVEYVGDESYHYAKTLDGMPLVKDGLGNLVYAELRDGELVPTTIVAHNAEGRNAFESTFVMANRHLGEAAQEVFMKHARNRNTLRMNQEAERINRARAKNNIGQSVQPFRMGEPRDPLLGKKKGLVILVNFKDKKMNAKHDKQAFDDMLNKVGYNGDASPVGSVHDYFYSQSYGKFDLTFDVAGPYELAHDMKYYGEDGETRIDWLVGEMIQEAVEHAHAEGFDFSNYDWDNDGEVDQVVVMYAGYGQAANPYSLGDAVWPHEYWLKWTSVGQKLKYDGVYIDKYACSSELCGASGSDFSGIGVLCHEFGHCLGLPDFYSTALDGVSGLDTWDPMDYGSYNGTERDRSDIPSSYTSYERSYVGWLDLKELKEPTNIADMAALEDKGEAYVIYNQAHKDEYYLLENRQLKGWDIAQKGHGMLALHVDFKQYDWNQNQVNRTDHLGMQIVPADGNRSSTAPNLAGDPYPGTTGNTALTDTSKPVAATLYNPNIDGRYYLGAPIEYISESEDGLISFCFKGGIPLEAPTALAPTEQADNTFRANWEEVDGAKSYTVQLLSQENSPLTSFIMSENFDKFEGTSSGGDFSNDCSNELDKLMHTTGWLGYKLYQSPSRVKFSVSKTNGYLISPVMEQPRSNSVTVRFTTEHHDSAPTVPFEIRIIKAQAQDYASEDAILKRIPVTAGDDTYVVALTGISEEYRVGFFPQGRTYMSSFAFYDGEFTSKDFEEGTPAAEFPPVRPVEQSIPAIKLPYSTPGLTDTYYIYKDIPAGDYYYRVRAVSGSMVGPWSELVPVTVKGEVADAIQYIESLAPETAVEIRTLDGRLVRRTTAANWNDNLQTGVYMVAGRKVTIK